MKWLKNLFGEKEEQKVRKFHVTMLATGFMSNTYKIFEFEAEGIDIKMAVRESLTGYHCMIIYKHYKYDGFSFDWNSLRYEYKEVFQSEKLNEQV